MTVHGVVGVWGLEPPQNHKHPDRLNPDRSRPKNTIFGHA